jgi:hypothetical protein
MKRSMPLVVLTLLLALMATPVLADGSDGDIVVWGRDYVLESDQEIKGNLLVYGGNVTLEPESEVKGDVTVFGGALIMSGEVKGDVTVWGGDVDIRAGATVRGQVMSVGGHVDRHPDADVRGEQIEGFPFERPFRQAPKTPIAPEAPKAPETPKNPDQPSVPPAPIDRRRGNDILRGIAGFFRSAFGVLLLVVLGILVVTFIPQHTDTVAEAMVKAPGKSFASGAVALLGGSVIVVILSTIGALLTATICLAPIGLAVLVLPILVAGVAVLFGWIAAGLLLGTKVLRAAMKKEPTPVAAVAAGILLLTLASNVPCVGWGFAIAALMWSMGAVIQTLFGTRPYSSVPIAASTAAADTNDLETDIDSDYDPRMDQL